MAEDKAVRLYAVAAEEGKGLRARVKCLEEQLRAAKQNEELRQRKEKEAIQQKEREKKRPLSALEQQVQDTLTRGKAEDALVALEQLLSMDSLDLLALNDPIAKLQKEFRDAKEAHERVGSVETGERYLKAFESKLAVQFADPKFRETFLAANIAGLSIGGLGLGLATAPTLTMAGLVIAEAAEKAALKAKFSENESIAIGVIASMVVPESKLVSVGKSALTTLEKTLALTESKAVQQLLNITRKPVTITLEDGSKKIIQQITGVKGCEWHHILSDKNDLIRNHKLLKVSGFDLQDASNFMLLPKVDAAAVSTTTRSVHQGRHVEDYSKGLAKKMDDIHIQGVAEGWTQTQYRVELEQLVSRTRQQLKNGEIHLNSKTRESLGLPLKGDQ